jgi:hypothetical protein
MVTKAIGRVEFIRLLPLRSCMERFIGKGIEWFSNKAGNVIGIIALGDSNRRWNYAIFRRNKKANFVACDVRDRFCNQAAARVDFMHAMAGTEKSERKVRRWRAA